MTITSHAHLRMNERITPMGFHFAENFARNEIETGLVSFTTCKEGKSKTKVINNGIIYIIDDTNEFEKVVVTVYLESEYQE